MEIENERTGGSGTLGFCAMRNGVKGYVTAGHFCKNVGDEISYNGTVIGTVKEHHFKYVGPVFCKYGNIVKKLGITAITD